MATTLLLRSVEHGVPSGNYDGSSLDFYSDVGKANTYYYGYNDHNFIEIRVYDFIGRIKVEGSLSNDPNFADWVELANFAFDDPAGQSAIQSVNNRGNYVWLRAHVLDFEAGVIDYVTSTYNIRENYFEEF